MNNQEVSIATAVRGSMRVRSVFSSFKMSDSMSCPHVAAALDEIGRMDPWTSADITRTFDRHGLGVGPDGIARRT
jgi:hypothetical protein